MRARKAANAAPSDERAVETYMPRLLAARLPRITWSVTSDLLVSEFKMMPVEQVTQ